MYVPRLLEAKIRDSRKSILLLGPRQVGKSTLIKNLRPDLTINLADETLFIELNSNLESFKDRIESKPVKTVFIDEVQRLPALLNLVQFYIDQKKGIKFYLTGSSARKLRRGGANLLPGRVLNFFLGPLVAKEANYKIDTEMALSFGTLPEIYQEHNDKNRRDLLRSYSTSYLKEEIQQEALVRNLPSFARFFQAACHAAGQFIDYSKMAKLAKISRHSVPRFFEILEDTLVAARLFPFEPSLESADLIKHPKFFLFDNGVYNGLLENFKPSADRRGVLLEQLIFNQVRSSCWAANKQCTSSSFRTRGGLEIDFIFSIEGEVIPIEVKSSDTILAEDLRGLKDFGKYFTGHFSPFLLHAGRKEIKKEGIWCLPWQGGLKQIGI